MMSESPSHPLQNPSRGQKRRAASPPELERRGRGHEGFQTQGQDRQKTFRHSRHHSTNSTTDFRSGAEENLDRLVCAICLSRAPHNVRICRATRRWDGAPTLYCRNSDSRITDSRGNVICSDWQRPKGCHSTRHRHECSGCGSTKHGAQDCPSAQPRNHNAPTA